MYGHTKGVRDLCVSVDGTSFLSAGMDNMVRLWDSETGQVSCDDVVCTRTCEVALCT
jgi:WD40 repeat protein